MSGTRTSYGSWAVRVLLGATLLACGACRTAGPAPGAGVAESGPTLVVYCDGSSGAALHATGWRAYVDSHGTQARWVDDSAELVNAVQKYAPRDVVILHRLTDAEPPWAQALRKHLGQHPEATIMWVLCMALEGPEPVYVGTMRVTALWTCFQTLLEIPYGAMHAGRERGEVCEVVSGIVWPELKPKPERMRPASPERKGKSGETHAQAVAELSEKIAREHGNLLHRRAQLEELGGGQCGDPRLLKIMKAHVVAVGAVHWDYDMALELSAPAAE